MEDEYNVFSLNIGMFKFKETRGDIDLELLHIPEQILEDGIDIKVLLSLNDDILLPILIRKVFIDDYGIFGLPSKQFMLNFVKLVGDKQVYDMGCGVGYFSYLFNKTHKYKKAIAMDTFETKYSNKIPLNNRKLWEQIIIVNAVECAREIKDSIIVISWPDYESSFAIDLCRNLDKSNEVYYFGESQGGCTADDNFFEKFNLEEHDLSALWFSWEGIHDRMFKVNLG